MEHSDGDEESDNEINGKFFETGFSKIYRFLERIPMEHIDIENSLDSKLQIYFTCSIRIRSRK